MDDATAPPSPTDAAPPPRPRRRGVLARRKRTLLTVALVLYTAALAVAIVDDIFRLGLFPTEQERRARRLIDRFDDPDEKARRRAVEELTRSADDRHVARLMHTPHRRGDPRHHGVDIWVAIPELIRALDSRSSTRRALAVECLRRLTRTQHGYDPQAPPPDRRAAAARWRRWWAESKVRY